MKTRELGSYAELEQALKEKEKSFLLLYKGDAEQSNCALSRLESLQFDVDLLTVDVSQVADVHTPLGVESAPSLVIFVKGMVHNILKGCQSASTYASLLEGRRIGTGQNSEGRQSRKAILYTSPGCSWCTTLKTYLDQNRVHYREIDVSRDQTAAKAMVRKSGQQGVPQTEINGQMIVGFDKARLARLLELN